MNHKKSTTQQQLTTNQKKWSDKSGKIINKATMVDWDGLIFRTATVLCDLMSNKKNEKKKKKKKRSQNKHSVGEPHVMVMHKANLSEQNNQRKGKIVSFRAQKAKISCHWLRQ